MLSTSELASLQNLLNDDNKTFEDLNRNINSTFDKSIHFKIYLTLNILIKENKLNISQEIAAFYILYCISNKEKDSSSFSSLAFEILNETKTNSKKIFLLDFIKNNITKDKMKIKIKDLIKLNEENRNIINIDEEIKKLKMNNSCYNKKIIINPLVYEKKILDNSINKNNIDLKMKRESFNSFESNYMSYYPFKDNNSLFKNELYWISPMLKHNFIWENSSYEKVHFLLNQILNNTPLTKEENKYIISSINKNQNIIKCINFTPNKMMCLIEKDESLSFEILSIICRTSLNE